MKKEELHPIDLACFERVANVIGHNAAVYELQRVIDSGIALDDDTNLYGCFVWEETPQGHGFWYVISKGKSSIECHPMKDQPKLTTLDKKYQEHFAGMIHNSGEPPEDATHVDFECGQFTICNWLKIEDGKEYFWDKEDQWLDAVEHGVKSDEKYPIPQKPWYNPADVDFKDHPEEEYTGGSVSYYKVKINKPTTLPEAYEAECNDIIEALHMNYAEGNAFKAIWRKCAARLGGTKKGYTDGLYDSEKVVFFGQRMVEQCKAENRV